MDMKKNKCVISTLALLETAHDQLGHLGEEKYKEEILKELERLYGMVSKLLDTHEVK